MENIEYLKVATVLKPVGLKGQFRIYSSTSYPEKRFKKGSKLFLFDGKEYKEVKINYSTHKEKMIYTIGLEGYETIESVECLQGFELCTIKDKKILKKDEFFYSDLVGLTVFDEDKNEIGIVSEVKEFPSQITLEVTKKTAETEHFVPFNDFFVKEISLENKSVIIHVIEGLLD